MTNVNVAAYFERIGHSGAHTPTLDTLREIVSAHTSAIAFENLDPLSGQPVALGATALEDKLVRAGRGGYCFEHNLLLGNVLQQLGYEVTGLAARVMWNANASDALTEPRSHMLLTVQIDGQAHIVDAGFGALTLTGVLQFEPRVEQRTPHEPFRLIAEGAEFVLQALVRGEWRPLYRFDLQRQDPVDYEATNWYLSTHPQSKFVNNLIAARVEPGRRYTLLNKSLAVHELNGTTQRRTLGSAAELRAVLEREFRLSVPRTAQMDAALTRITEAPDPRSA